MLFQSFMRWACFVSVATATQFCACRGGKYGDSKFYGIQKVCKGASEWCPTNCNFFGYDCDYCQYKPNGFAPDDEVYHALKKWCIKQSYQIGDSRQFGKDISCYSQSNKVDLSTFWAGCSHQDNGPFPLPPPPRPNAHLEALRQELPGTFRIIVERPGQEKMRFEEVDDIICDYVYIPTAKRIQEAFSAQHKDQCERTKDRPVIGASGVPKSRYQKFCVFSEGEEEKNARKDLDKLCKDIGGVDQKAELSKAAAAKQNAPSKE